MKNKWITRIGIWLCLLLTGYMGQAQTTSLDVGTVNNGVGVITNLTNARHVLTKNLPAGAAVSDLKVEYSEYDGKYFLTGKVSNNAISSIGIQLTQSGNALSAVAGPGVEITCIGYNCSDCRIAFSKYRPYCKCFQPNPPDDMRCDMTSKITISL
jgi:hypothetical protein